MTARPAVALMDGRIEVERELVADVLALGPPALLALRRTTPWTPAWLTGPRRPAVEAADALALLGQAGPFSGDAIAAEIRRHGGGDELAEAARQEVEDALEVYGGTLVPGQIGWMGALEALAGALADAAVEDGSETSPTAAVPRPLSVDMLRRARTRELLSVADLPLRHGLGEDFDRALGGGLAPGDLVAIGASNAGAGKTALAMQIADGLALRSVELVRTGAPGVVTPMLLVSEIAPEDLACRTIARCAMVPHAILLAGRTAERYLGAAEVDRVYRAAEELVRGPLADLPNWQLVVQPGVARDLLAAVTDMLGVLRERTARTHPDREVWPILVVDPIQRWLDPETPEVEALSRLAEDLDAAADREGWIILATSDTTKASATGESIGGVAALRGSMKLLHACDAVLLLEPGERVEDAGTPRAARVECLKSRRGPAGATVPLAWWAGRGLRYEAMRVVDPTEQREAERRREWDDLGRLYDVVAQALAVRPAVSPSWLRDQRRAEIGVPARAVEALVARALERGILTARSRTERGITLGLGHDPRQPVACPSPSESSESGHGDAP